MRMWRCGSALPGASSFRCWRSSTNVATLVIKHGCTVIGCNIIASGPWRTGGI